MEKEGKNSALAINKVPLKAQKDEGLSVVHYKALYYLNRGPKTRSNIIKFPEVYRTLSWLFHLSKSEAREFLKELQRAGLIEVVPFNGIRITVGVG